MIATSSRAPASRSVIAIAILLAAPIASLVINGISWLHYGIDLPFYDDVRPFLNRTAGSLDPRVLFVPSNDTLYPVGMALDALAQRYLDGNSIAYQFVSMMVMLGGLMWLQWRLLLSALQDRLQAAAAFSLTLFMLWPESYWGLQNLAYHHGLPLLFLLAALALILTTAWSAWWGVPTVFVLGVLAGLSYISGAFATLAAGLTLCVLAIYARAIIPALRSGGPSLLAAGVVTASAQLWVILGHQQGHISVPSAPWALPTDAGFWMYIFGKIGRGLALPIGRPGLSLVIVLVVLALTLLLAVRLVRHLMRERSATPDGVARTTIVFLTLSAILAAYLPLLAAGRAFSGEPQPHTLMGLFMHGFPEHYHPFWVTIVIPWIGAAALVTWRGALPTSAGLRTYAVPVAAGLLVIGAWYAGAFEHSVYYRVITDWRMRNDVVCVRTALQTGKVTCPERYGPQLIGVLRFGRQIKASFVRQFTLPAIPLGTEDPPPLYRFSTLENKAELSGEAPTPVADGFLFAGKHDPNLGLNLPAGSLSACWELEVNMDIKPGRDEFSELWTLMPGQGDFAGPSASQAHPPKDVFTAVTLRAYSLSGFQDRLRLDAVAGDDDYTIREIEVRCRASLPGPND